MTAHDDKSMIEERATGIDLGALICVLSGAFVVGCVLIVVTSLIGCSPAPARNRVTPGTAGVAREVRGPIEWRLEVTQPRPQRVYVPTEAEEVER